MTILFKLLATVTAVAAAVPRPAPIQQDSYNPQVALLIDPAAFGSYNVPATELQVPRAEPAQNVFFAPPPPNAHLTAPPQQYQPDPNYYQVPIPAQELRAPLQTAWNPDNDPKYYYELPAVLSKQDVPTAAFPKKYNKDIHIKEKPYAFKPKTEIALEPISERQLEAKEKDLHKLYDGLAKKENRKQVEDEKVAKKEDAQIAASNFGEGFDAERLDHQAEDSQGDYSQGLSAELTQSLGIEHSPAHGERLEFHMTGHDGPHSYKWGFDTGKGHNRQFRFEEKDKDGLVKGHFGFYDKDGKLKMISYDAHPLEGYHAEGNFGKP